MLPSILVLSLWEKIAVLLRLPPRSSIYALRKGVANSVGDQQEMIVHQRRREDPDGFPHFAESAVFSDLFRRQLDELDRYLLRTEDASPAPHAVLTPELARRWRIALRGPAEGDRLTNCGPSETSSTPYPAVRRADCGARSIRSLTPSTWPNA
jgi:hypothetical protein